MGWDAGYAGKRAEMGRGQKKKENLEVEGI